MSKRLFRFPLAVVLAGLTFLTGCGSIIADPNGPAPGDTAAQEAL